jgi:hypothetical protein
MRKPHNVWTDQQRPVAVSRMTWSHVPHTETASQGQVPCRLHLLRLSTDMVDLHWLKSAPESLGFTSHWPVGCSLM